MALPPHRDLTSHRVATSSLTPDGRVLLSSNVLCVSVKTLVLTSPMKLHDPGMRIAGGGGSTLHPDVPPVLGGKCGTTAWNPGTSASFKLNPWILRVWALHRFLWKPQLCVDLKSLGQARLGTLVWEAGQGELEGRPSPRAQLGSACSKHSLEMASQPELCRA